MNNYFDKFCQSSAPEIMTLCKRVPHYQGYITNKICLKNCRDYTKRSLFSRGTSWKQASKTVSQFSGQNIILSLRKKQMYLEIFASKYYIH